MNGNQALYFGIAATLITLGLFVYATYAWWRSSKAKAGEVDDEAGSDRDEEALAGGEEQAGDAPSVAADQDSESASLDLKEAATQQIRLSKQGKRGTLLVQAGEKTYKSSAELQASEDWDTIKDLSEELAKWFEATEPPPRLFSFGGTMDEEEPESMIDAINKIIERRSLESQEVPRGVRLVEERGGDVRVLVGVRSYLPQELTDPDVRRLIKQAVAEWEARQ